MAVDKPDAELANLNDLGLREVCVLVKVTAHDVEARREAAKFVKLREENTKKGRAESAAITLGCDRRKLTCSLLTRLPVQITCCCKEGQRPEEP